MRGAEAYVGRFGERGDALDQSTPALLRSIAIDSAALARSEFALAKEEVRGTLLGLRWTAVGIVVAALLGLISLQLFALTVALSFKLGPGAALLGALLSLLIAGGVGFQAYRRLEGFLLVRTRRRLHDLLEGDSV